MQSEVRPKEIRYIKLGDGGRWAADAFKGNYIPFGYHAVPHDMCSARDWAAVRSILWDSRRSEGAVTAGVNEVKAFYTLGSDCLWITIADGHLWWAFAKSEVLPHSPSPAGPSRSRPTAGSWKNQDIYGRPLRVEQLSSRLTQVGGFRATICQIKEREYLLRRLNGLEEPLVRKANQARAALIAVAADMISALHWADFETLADMIFLRAGWQRTSRLGGLLPDADIIMEQPTTGERAFVQVKSKADQSVLDDYLARFRSSQCDRFFFLCHSPVGTLVLSPSPKLHLWQGLSLAEATVQNGLIDWLVDRSG